MRPNGALRCAAALCLVTAASALCPLPSCDDHECDAGKVLKAGAASIECDVACDDAKCCRTMCDTHKCRAGTSRSTAAAVECGDTCTDETCCVSSCNDHSCGAGNRIPAARNTQCPALDAGSCTDELCCVSYCPDHTCTVGVRRVNAGDIPCAGLAAATCTDETCCILECSAHTCGKGVAKTGPAVKYYCGSVAQSSCTDELCCDITMCSAHTCGAHTKIANAATTVCGDGVAVASCDDASCCSAKCSEHTCSAGLFANAAAAGTACGRETSDCTDALCCTKKCTDHTCTQGNLNAAALCLGITNADCTDEKCCTVITCSSHRCDGMGLTKKADAGVKVCGRGVDADDCSDSLCCDAKCDTFKCPADLQLVNGAPNLVCGSGLDACTAALCCDVTPTLTLRTESVTLTQTLSETQSLRAHNCYAGAIGPLAVAASDQSPLHGTNDKFREGQEVRVKLTAVWADEKGRQTRAHFRNGALRASNPNEFTLKVFAVDAARGTDCARYVEANGPTPLEEKNSYGMDGAEAPYSHHAYVTFTAPRRGTSFLVCFRHFLRPEDGFNIPSETNGVYQLFENAAGTKVFSTIAADVWYHLPDASAGQYAIVQLLTTDAEQDFTHGPSSAGCPDCVNGDNLKIVRKGEPCTYEHTDQNIFIGSKYTTDTGDWVATGSSTEELFEGATAGGAGLFGTQYANPLTDKWSDSGSYAAANAVGDVTIPPPTAQGAKSHAYVYVRLPTAAGTEYDVCFSSRRERKNIRVNEKTLPNMPQWKKLNRCANPAAGCAASDTSRSFAVAAEKVGWSMVDLAPGSWGDIVFDDSGEAKLSSAPTQRDAVGMAAQPSTPEKPALLSDTANYWAPAGGDTFKIVPASAFTEQEKDGRVRDGPIKIGSRPSLGCWDRSRDDKPPARSTVGGFVESGATYPVGSRNLRGDPTVADAAGDASGLAATYSTAFVQANKGEYFVCYRRVCAAGTAGCAASSGWRVLPFHKTGRGNTPARFRHLEDDYTYGTDAKAKNGAHVMVAGVYGDEKKVPQATTWELADSTPGTWAPIVVEKEVTMPEYALDTRPWNFVRPYGSNERVMETKGAALRLVQMGYPCTGHPAVFESKDGGALECETAKSQTDTTECAGSASNKASTNTAVFYSHIPEGTSQRYEVCHRVSAYNWRVLPRKAGSSVIVPAESWLSNVALTLTEKRGGMEALLLLSDASAKLAVAERGTCTGSCPSPPVALEPGDVVRFRRAGGDGVADSRGCDVNPLNWRAAHADAHLSAYCHVAGSGSKAKSGLFFAGAGTATTCAKHANTLALCGAAAGEATCGASSALSAARFEVFAERTPDLYDDIVPHDVSLYSQTRAVASLRLPTYDASTASNNVYHVCYKSPQSKSWKVLDAAFEVKPPPAFDLSYPAQPNLVGGLLQRFEVTASADNRFASSLAVKAKLVRVQVEGESDQGCLNEPGSTEGEAFASATSGRNLLDGGAKFEFFLAVPHAAGRYRLCVGAYSTPETRTAWWTRSGVAEYVVLDNGVRWFTKPGFEPTNNGVSVVSLVKCALGSNGVCDPAKSIETFDTSPGADSAKIVKASCHCHDGDANAASHAGSSTHVGAEGGGTAGVTDLLPANGPADVAELRVTLPGVAGDARTGYKVCARTLLTHAGIGGAQGQRRWVEVAQASGVSGQHRVLRPGDDASLFLTEPGLMESWSIDPALAPANSVLTGAGSDSVVLAGASTRYVGNPASAAGAAVVKAGFHFNAYSAGTPNVNEENLFKLVPWKRPITDSPSGFAYIKEWGKTANWEEAEGGADCLSPGEASASNTGDVPCKATAAAGCASIEEPEPSARKVSAAFQVPLSPGSYKVCYKVKAASLTRPKPWLWLPSAVGKDRALWTHPAFLEAASVGQVVPSTDLRVVDRRTALSWQGNNKEVSIASWCGGDGGVDCVADNGDGGFAHDLVSVVNDTQVCPTPGSAPVGGGPPAWYSLSRKSTVALGVLKTWGDDTSKAFSLPPPLGRRAASGQYKLCLYKAGAVTTDNMPNATATYVAKAGVVYQLRVAADGATSGVWRDWAARPAKLVVTSDLVFDGKKRFTEYADDLESKYGQAAIDADLVKDPVTGKVSRTPLLRSGSTVDYRVAVATETGDVIPTGSYPVEVLRCAPAADWTTGLRCGGTAAHHLPGVSPGHFILRNSAGACSAADALVYGWERDGLRQFTHRGRVAFALQFRSACPSGEFGCGLKFRATVTRGAAPLESAAQWVNVNERYPDSLRIDTEDVLPNTDAVTWGEHAGCQGTGSPRCYMKTCPHGQVCKVDFQSRFDGPPEFAPLGTLSLAYSSKDYAGQIVLPTEVEAAFGHSAGSLFQNVAWGLGGALSYSFTPRLQGMRDDSYLYLNVTFGEGGAAKWARFVVHVQKPVLHSIELEAVEPIDVERGLTVARVPAPSVLPGSARNDASLPGWGMQSPMYLEALVSYRVRYVPKDANGKRLPAVWGALVGWVVTAEIEESDDNLVLAADEQNAASAFHTDPRKLGGEALRYTTTDETAITEGYAVPFRVYVSNNACSRFRTAPKAGGCTIKFTFSKGSRKVTATMVTPVRVPARTLQVTAEDASERTATQGIEVTAYPGTYVQDPRHNSVFVYDEFHYGDIFALNDGPPPTDGATNRDGLRMLPDNSRKSSTGCAFNGPSGSDACAVYKYPTRMLENRWGATWTMRPNKPCNKCRFTFHSTLGAGPDSFHMQGTSPAGVKTLTFHEDLVSLKCSNVDVTYEQGVGSQGFSVTVRAEVQGQSSTTVRYAKMALFSGAAQLTHASATSATAGAYSLLLGDEPLTTVAVKMGDTGIAKLTGLRFAANGTVQPSAHIPEEFVLKVRGTGHRYNSGSQHPEGSRPHATQVYECTSMITVSRKAPAVVVPPVKPPLSFKVKVTSVDGATAVTNTDGESWYKTSVNNMANAGVTIVATFFNTTLGDDDAPKDERVRNITIVPLGGPATSPRNAAPAWTYDRAEARWVSDDLVLDSVHNPSTLPSDGDSNKYTWGSLNARAERADKNNQFASVSAGVSYLTLRYHKTTDDPYDKAPVRKAQFKICGATYTKVGGEETEETLCTTVSLWVEVFQETVQKKTLFWQLPTGDSTTIIRGPSSACGGEAVTVKVNSYYTVPSVVTEKLRFWAYGERLTYTLDTTAKAPAPPAAAKQYLVKSSSTTLVEQLEVESTAPLNDHLSIGHSSFGVTFSFYATESTLGKIAFRVKTAREVTGGAAVADVTTAYDFEVTPPKETLAEWVVSDSVQLDEECPTTRRFMTTTNNYKTYSTSGAPLAGWKYDAGEKGAVSGVPFPIQTVLTNSDGERARSASPSLVRVSKRSWGSCGNGGDLTVWDLHKTGRNQGEVKLEGSLSSFTPAAGEAVRMHQGVATPFVRLSEGCERCVLQLDLCYSGNTAANCLDQSGVSDTDATDATPVLAGRTKLTKPFSVMKPKVTTMHVVSQEVPTPSEALGGIAVGQEFLVAVENVLHFGENWAMQDVAGGSGWTRKVWVRSVWQSSEAERATSVHMRYGHGGFVVDGAAHASSQSACSSPVSVAAFRSALALRDLAGSADGNLKFFFARPCSRCEVWLDYELTPPPGMAGVHAVKTGSFPLRSYSSFKPGNRLSYRIVTCGAGWLPAGPPVVAVRRRQPFSLTVLKVDANNVPAFRNAANDNPSFATTAQASVGNGEGGLPRVTSPTATGGSTVAPSEGSATLRLSSGKACYQCGVMFGAHAQPFTVLTDATQIIAVPRYSSRSRVRLATEQNIDAPKLWDFEVYAADDVGDRSYTVSGPTQFAFHPMYATPYPGGSFRAPGTLGVASVGSGEVSYNNVKLDDPVYSFNALSTGRRSVNVKVGTRVANGVPSNVLAHGEGAASVLSVATATVELTTQNPAVDVDLAFSFSSAPGLPTNFLGVQKRPRVHYPAQATRMGVTDPARTPSGTGECTGDDVAVSDGGCFFRAYAMGRAPKASRASGQWFLSNLPVVGEAEANVTCVDDCATVDYTETASFDGGIAKFNIRATAIAAGHTGRCRCSVALQPPASLAAEGAPAQSLNVYFIRSSPLTTWKWTPSETLKRSSPIFTNARSVFNRSVELQLRAYDSVGRAHSGSSLTWSAGARVRVSETSMSPKGCFHCLGRTEVGATRVECPVIFNGDDKGHVSIFGVFRNVGGCTIGAVAVSELPVTAAGVTTAASSSLTVTVEPPKTVELVPTQSLTQLTGRTLQNKKAAVVGTGTVVTLRVVDASGDAVSGDNHMKFVLSGSRRDADGNTTGDPWTTATAVAKEGYVTFRLDSPDTTRTTDCEALDTTATAAERAACEHTPWYFSVAASAPLSLNGEVPTSASSNIVPVATISDIGPVYFVKRAVALVATAETGVACGAAAPAPACPPTGTPAWLAEKAAAGEPGLTASFAYADSPSTLPATHPAQAKHGKAMDVTVYAVDKSGAVVSHIEDIGSEAVVHFTPVGVPCRNTDEGMSGAYVTSTCVDLPNGNHGACVVTGSIPTLTPCNAKLSSGWTLPEYKFSLAAGKKVLANASYTGRPGVVRFLLTTDGFSYPALQDDDVTLHDPMATPEDTSSAAFPFEINMQVVSDVRAYDDTTKSALVCDMAKYGSDTMTTTSPTTLPHRCPLPDTIKPAALVPFTFKGALVDSDGDAVAHATGLTVSLSGRCLDSNGVNTAFFVHKRDDGSLSYVGLPDLPVTNGLFEASSLVVTDDCASMEMYVEVTGAAVAASPLTFAVSPSPTNDTAPVTPQSQVTLSSFVLTTGLLRLDALDFITKYKGPVAQAQLLAFLRVKYPVLASVTLKWLCLFVDGGSLEITDAAKGQADVCKDMTAMAPVSPGRSADAQAVVERFTVVAEFQMKTHMTVNAGVLAAGIVASIKTDLASTTSVLKSIPAGQLASPFATADAAAVVTDSPIETPVPDTPAPPPTTPTPPAITPTASPPSPPVATDVPKTFSPLEGAPAGATYSTVMAVVVVAATMLLML